MLWLRPRIVRNEESKMLCPSIAAFIRYSKTLGKHNKANKKWCARLVWGINDDYDEDGCGGWEAILYKSSALARGPPLIPPPQSDSRPTPGKCPLRWSKNFYNFYILFCNSHF